ncbi:phage tail terminator family protein [Lysinibacillus sphaericus]|uniref:Uncharacterized protein n=1 Tax=Lysinibacillus sphaericus OT4b.31 TaxID=1285586 RepID=R7Z8V4_LYSSH|nr:hypothetical protein [Lysinibacillus sphaericus]EON70459.1 hypothetical protein H131_21282 [Lysinibacillus sphaericus OT4b.31]
MINLKDIKASINQILKSNFKIPVIAQDIEKGFERPSFTVYFDNVKIETLYSQFETSLTVRIYYFTEIESVNGSLEILDMQQQLPILFGNNLKVKDRAIHISDVDSSVVDGILMCEFSLLFEQFDEINDSNKDALLMQELETKLNESE